MELKYSIIKEIIESYKEYKKSFPEPGKELTPMSKAKSMDSNNPKKKRLVEQIRKLKPSEWAELTAVMWIGRGDGEAEDFETMKQHAESVRTSPEGDIDYLIEKKDLDKYLAKGIEKLKINSD